MKSSQGSASQLLIRQAWIGQSVKKSLLSLVFFGAGCSMLAGPFLLSVFFFFPFPAILHFMCITVLFPYTSGIFLYMWLLVMFHWLSVSLTTARVLCSPSNLYMPVHPMCNNHCNAFNVSPPLLLSLRLALCHPWSLWKSTSWDDIQNSCHGRQHLTGLFLHLNL